MKSNKRKTISMKKIFYYVMALALGMFPDVMQ